VGLEAGALLERLSRDIADALGPDLVGLYVHGSWALGDFHPGRSDVDLLAVLDTDPTAATADTLRILHARLAADHPEWADRVEVEYLSEVALAGFRTEPRPMVRISPGEPLHLLPATRHYLLNWYAARERGVALRGPRARAVIPAISEAEWIEVVRDHARNWPSWIEDVRGPGGQAYAVLTLCRALLAVQEGRQASKRAAAAWAVTAVPEHAGLVAWAAGCWYGDGTDAGGGRDVVGFVNQVSARITASP
jgi:predicted nucleotidyltransferase